MASNSFWYNSSPSASHIQWPDGRVNTDKYFCTRKTRYNKYQIMLVVIQWYYFREF